MKKAFYCLAMELLMPLIVEAVTWTGDSNQFKWNDDTPVIEANQQIQTKATLQYRAEFSRGSLTILYNLPASVSGARLIIYDVSGSLIKDFALKCGKGAIHWSFESDSVAAGVYVACMRYGTADKKIQIAIIK
jgi:hypothetical protein